MKLVKTASGKQTIKMSKKEWQSIGKTAGWDSGDPTRTGIADDNDIQDFKDNLRSMSNSLSAIQSIIGDVPNNDLSWYMDYYGISKGNILNSVKEKLKGIADDFISGSFKDNKGEL